MSDGMTEMTRRQVEIDRQKKENEASERYYESQSIATRIAQTRIKLRKLEDLYEELTKEV